MLLELITAWLVSAGPWIVFLVTLLETAVFLGLLVPAEATVLFAAFLAEEGYFPLGQIAAATFFGGLLGDQIGYALGRWGIRFGGRSSVDASRRRYEGLTARLVRKHSLLGISLARFLSFIRTLMPWFAGRTGVSYPRFLVYDAAGVLGWAAASVALGWVAGRSWRTVASILGTAGGLVLAALLLVLLVTAHRQGRLRFPRVRRRLLGEDAGERAAPPYGQPGPERTDADDAGRPEVGPDVGAGTGDGARGAGHPS